MKKLFLFILSVGILSNVSTFAQEDKSKRPSPPAKVTTTLTSGTTVTIDYSQPAIKGRTIGTDIAPYGKVWRTGANEATIFEVNKDVKVEGKALKAGKYAIHSIPGENVWVIILNKEWQKSGTKHTEAEDALRFNIKPTKAPSFTEKMTFTVSKAGKVSLTWGDTQINFNVK